MLDRVIATDPSHTTCRVAVRADSTFGGPDGVPALVSIEYMAQTVAAHAGLHSAQADQSHPAPPCIGYLVGVRSFTLAIDRFAVGDELDVTVEHLWGQAQGSQFRATVTRAGAVIAQGELTVVVPPAERRP